MNKEIFRKIFNKHKNQLKNLNEKHEKLVICFSAIPGSGKTYVSKILEKKYKAVRISNDNIRKIILRIFQDKTDDQRQTLLKEYFKQFLKHYNFQNKLIILDFGIDRKYTWLFPLLKDGEYKIFIIKIKSTPELIEKRVIKKLGILDQNYIKNIERWRKEFNEFENNYNSDIILENKEVINLIPLFEKLDRLIL